MSRPSQQEIDQAIAIVENCTTPGMTPVLGVLRRLRDPEEGLEEGGERPRSPGSDEIPEPDTIGRRSQEAVSQGGAVQRTIQEDLAEHAPGDETIRLGLDT